MKAQTLVELHERYFELVEDEQFSYDKALNEFTRTGDTGAEWGEYVILRSARTEFENVIRTIGLSGLIEIVEEEGEA